MISGNQSIGSTRIRRIQEKMESNGVDWVYLGEGPNMVFATGHVAKPPAARLDKVRLKSVLIPREGTSVFICPALLASNVKETSWIDEVVIPPSGSEHFEQIRRILSPDNGIRLGIDEKLMWGVVQRLKNVLELSSELVDVTSIFNDLRLIKDEDEITLLREASNIADYALNEAITSIEPGKTEFDIANRIVFAVREKEGECTVAQVVSGAGRYPEDPTDKGIEKGDIITLDVNVAYMGYYSDETRVAVVGSPDQEQKRVHEIVFNANKKARDAVKPGVLGKEVHEVGAKVISEHGYEKYFTHGIGHGLGVEGHESPYLNARSNEVLKPGMVHTIEPAIYGRTIGKFNIRLEDVVLITEDGAELLTKLSHDLIQV